MGDGGLDALSKVQLHSAIQGTWNISCENQAICWLYHADQGISKS